MTHVLPPHPQLDIRSSEAQNPIQQMDQQQSHIDPQQPPQAQAQPPPPPGRKRKKADNGEPSTPAEPRRLRRSHEACARCRSKKIKVSTQASAVIFFPPMRTSWQVPSVNTAGNFLHSHSLVLLFSLSLYSAILNTHDAPLAQLRAPLVTRRIGTARPSPFAVTQSISNRNSLSAMLFLNAVFLALKWTTWTIYSLVRVSKSRQPYHLLFPPPSNLPRVQVCLFFLLRALRPHISSILGGSSPPKGYPYVPPGPHMMPPGYAPMPPYYAAPNGAPYPPPPHMQPHPGYNPHLHPMFQHPPQPIPSQHLPPAQSVPRPLSSTGPVPDIKGGDPGFHDMSNPRVCIALGLLRQSRHPNNFDPRRSPRASVLLQISCKISSLDPSLLTKRILPLVRMASYQVVTVWQLRQLSQMMSTNGFSSPCAATA